jgi:hypothetical protein
MSVADVKNAFERAAQSGQVDLSELEVVLSSAGNIGVDEEKALAEASRQYATKLDPKTRRALMEKLEELGELRRSAAATNAQVTLEHARLLAEAKKRLSAGVATTTFGGSALPDAVKATVSVALEAGAIAYDVRELKPDPFYDVSHDDHELSLDGKYNPYAQESSPVDSLAFTYTELTPARVRQDMITLQSVNVLAGYSPDGRTAKLEQRMMRGNGNITELYDEATWFDTFARGPGGQKYASNFAILADGSVHCVPASRRSKGDPHVILTTASLARGQLMLFNGHLHMDRGIVTYVGMSGRLCKLAERVTVFVDPVEILKAWGFSLAPALSVTKEG